MSTLMLFVGFFFFVLATAGLAGYLLFTRREASDAGGEIHGNIGDENHEGGAKLLMLRAFHALGEMMPSSEASRVSMRKRLNHAGYRRHMDTASYFGLKCVCALFLALLFSGIALLTGDDGSRVFTSAVCGLGLGFLGPERFLDAQIRSRNNRMRRALPPALDLMVMSLEAGQPLDQGLLLASRGLQNFSPDLSAEFQSVYLETRASKSRAESIRHMAERNTEPEIHKFCTLLLDSDRFGSSLAPALRQHAKFLRIRSRQRAQEAARKLTVKMVFPVFFLIFPAILVVTLGPAVLTMSKYFRTLTEP